MATNQRQGTTPQPGVVLDVVWPSFIQEAPVNNPLIHQVVVAQQAAARQGTHATKVRGHVSGGGRKPYKQKGTGRARQGSITAPQFRGGGTVHGPQPRSYEQHTPKKMIKGALRQALGDKVRGGRVTVISDLVVGSAPSTKTANRFLHDLAEVKRYLVVLTRDDTTSELSVRNLQAAHALWVDQLNARDVVNADCIVFTEASFDSFIHGGEPADTESEDKPNVQGERPQSGSRGMLEKEHEDGQRPVLVALDLTAAYRRALTMKGIRTFRRKSNDVHATSFVTDGLDPVAVERYDDLVLVSWPTHLSCPDALRFLAEYSTRAPKHEGVTLYAGGEQASFGFEDGDPIDWSTLHKVSNTLEYVRLELETETLIWRRPDGPDENTNRFAALERSLTSPRLYNLVDATATRDVSALLNQTLGKRPWILQPLSETA